MSLAYKLQSMAARMERLEKNISTLSSFPEFSFNAYGASMEIQELEESEVLIAGAAGTGKSTACLAKVHQLCLDTPHLRVLMARKTKASMAESILHTFEANILGQGHPLLKGPTRINRKNYVYPNGARIVVGGMDNPNRIMSTDYDLIYVQEATELSIEDWENLLSRLRNGVLHYQQILADCNPSSPKHWLNLRALNGSLRMLKSVHEDNPSLYNPETGWTEEGVRYMEKLDNLTGVRYRRLRLGEWSVAEGAVYPEFDPQRHTMTGLLPQFKRYVTGIDWGFRHAGAMLTFGETPDGHLILVDEVYRTGQTIQWWLEQGRAVKARFGKAHEVFVADPSQPAHIQQFNLSGLKTNKANNKIPFGVKLVQERLKAGTIKFHMNSLKQADPELKQSMKPYRLTDEIVGYVFDDSKETPLAVENEACDAMRYVVSYVDKARNPMMPATSTSIGQFDRKK